MRSTAYTFLLLIFLFGCLGGNTGNDDYVTMNNTTGQYGDYSNDNSTFQYEKNEDCVDPTYTFSRMDEGILSQTSILIATVTCAGGKEILIYIDDQLIGRQTITSDEATPLNFPIIGINDGISRITALVGDDTIMSRDWEVKPLGNEEPGKNDYDAISFKEWRAMAFDIGNEIEVGQVKAYMKRLDSNFQPGTSVIAEIRGNDNGEPGALIAAGTVPSNEVPLNKRWIIFDLDSKTKLAPGRYWVVLKIEQTESVHLVSDVVNVYYNTADSYATGNSYTKEMRLFVNLSTGYATETNWQPLPYDKEYSIVLSTGK
ncbi:hypothetical protein KKF81_06315 [Candidatus Micrarchaeota archaeon]|nr:hypothetical protein [Candidatus Micrarchaeota archaeon]MBU1166543.1 hypothetical protein [Candidatus Micrarchaeota archaeon]MBU1887555.1 hypothetical protein [Candidatus Micrarchaeota archaeon]